MNPILLDPNLEGASGGGELNTAQNIFEGSQIPEGQVEEEGSAAPSAVPVAKPAAQAQSPALVGLSKAEFAEIMSKTVGAAQQPAPQKVYTEAEFNKAFNVVEVAKEHLEELGLPVNEKSLKRMTKLLHATARQAATMSNYQLQQLEAKLMGQLNPVLEHVKSTQEKALENEFITKYPHLEPYRPICEAVKAQMTAEGFRAPTKEAVFEEFAKRADAMLKQIPGLTVQNGKPATNGTQKTSTPSKMTTLSRGGQGGTGSAAATGVVNNTAKAIFG